MRLKMAENSLFAILMRSPWWASAGVALAVGVLAQALAPDAYRGFAAAGGLPFLVIAAIAARRQWRTPGPNRVAAVDAACRAMQWQTFGAAIAAALRDQGYAVSPLPNGAADFAATREGLTLLIACRRWKAARTGVETLRGLDAERRARNASGALWIGLGEIGPEAAEYARSCDIRIVGAVTLTEWLGRSLAEHPGRSA